MLCRVEHKKEPGLLLRFVSFLLKKKVRPSNKPGLDVNNLEGRSASAHKQEMMQYLSPFSSASQSRVCTLVAICPD